MPRKPGRPTIASETPQILLQKDLRETLKLNQRIRDLITLQVEEIAKAAATMTPPQRLEMITALTASLAGQAKGIDSVAKHILAATESEGGTDDSTESILKDLIGGRR